MSRAQQTANASIGAQREPGVRLRAYRTGWPAVAGLAMAVSLPVVCPAQRNTFHAVQQGHSAPAQALRPSQGHPAPTYHPSRPAQQAVPRPHGHAGDWLRRYKDLPPAEQERALQNDPAFRRLPPAQQERLRQRLQHFSNLPPQQQLRMLNRMDTWEHLTPEQKQQARQIFNQMRQLPPDRQRMVTTAIRDLRPMSPDQRERVIDSPRFKGSFSDQEREMIRGASRLPLAPGEGEPAPGTDANSQR